MQRRKRPCPISIAALTSVAAIGIACATFASQIAAAEQLSPECGRLHSAGQHGPFDYRTQTQEQKDLVELAHFNTEYEAYLRGEAITDTKWGRMAPAAGFDYTLRAFPNHHRALAAMDRLSLKLPTDKPKGSRFTARCWFERAVVFTPDDPLVRALYGVYLSKRKAAPLAEEQLKVAVSNGSEDASVLIQVAFAYMNLKQYDLAKTYAARAYDLGYPAFGLRDQLKAMGKWD